MAFLFRHPWLRRCTTTCVLLVAFCLALILTPIALIVFATIDIVGRRTHLVRFWVFLFYFITLELSGLMRAAFIYGSSTPGPRRVARFFRLQAWWASRLFSFASRLFRFRVSVTGADCLDAGTFTLMMRHASVADTLIPATFVQYERQRPMGYVLKEALQLDPCLDIVGHALPCCFVRRGQDAESERHKVRALARRLDTLDAGSVIFPEGTRFTNAKRERLLSRLAAGEDDARLRRAAELRNVLPPRLGGALELLAGSRGDVVFCAHTGFERIERLSDLWRPKLFGAQIRIVFWRVARAEIPPTAPGQTDWLFGQWARVDEAIDRLLEADQSV